MATKLTPASWDIIVDSTKKRVAANSNAEIHEVFESLLDNTIPRSVGVDAGDFEIVVGKLTESGEYICERLGAELHVKKNPSYDLDQNIKATNVSVQQLNGLLRTTNTWAVIIAATTGLFIAMTFFKNDTKDLQILNFKLDRQAQILDSMLQLEIKKESKNQAILIDSAKNKRK
jgi:hypothetical protein